MKPFRKNSFICLSLIFLIPNFVYSILLRTNRDLKAVNEELLNLTSVKWASTPINCFLRCSQPLGTDSNLVSQFFLDSEKCNCFTCASQSLVDFSDAEESSDGVWIYSSEFAFKFFFFTFCY